MIQIEFNYKGQLINVQCNEKEKIKNIYSRFCSKAQLDINKIYFIYSGSVLNEELTIESVINQFDNSRKKMNIIVDLKYGQINNKNNLIKAEQIICPQCKETAKIFIKDYLITIFGCKHNHTTNNILLNQFEESQKIDESKVVCNVCKTRNKEKSFNKQFYICLKCKLNLCPLCKDIHDKNHYIIDYNNKNYICPQHGDNYSSFCQTCSKNICIECENSHSTHNIIYFGKILPNKDNLNGILNELKNNIDKFKLDLSNIIEKLNYVKNNVDNYYKLVKDIYDSLKIQKKNYEIIFNICNINNNDFMNEINNVINDSNILNKFTKINSIYDKMKGHFRGDSSYMASFSGNFHIEEDTISRIQREFNEVKEIMIGAVCMYVGDFKLLNNNIFEWIFSINGPDNSPYYGGKFYLKIIFPKDYPKHRPEAIFVTPFYHINVNPNPSKGYCEPLGHISTGILNWWYPKISIKEVIIDICFFFFMQNPDSPYGLERADLYNKNRQKFNERIKYFTKKYANPSLPYKEYNSWDFTYPYK